MSLLDKIGAGLTKFGASPVGKGAISFLRDQPITEIENEMARNELLEQEGRIRKTTADSAEADLRQQPEIEQLRRAAASGSIDAQIELFSRSPEDAIKATELAGLNTEKKLRDAAVFADKVLAVKDPALRRQMIEERFREDPERFKHTGSLLDMSPADMDASLRAMSAAINTARGGGDGIGFEEGFFNRTIADLSPEEQKQARRIQAKLEAPAGMSAAERIALSEELTRLVAESKAKIAEKTAFAKTTGTDRANRIDAAADKIRKMDAHLRNLDKAMGALDGGASTGAVESQFAPTLRESTVILEQIQNELGLDIVGAVTFGQLSEKELELVLATALPTKLQPKALRKWLEDRKNAQMKLRSDLLDMVDFLDDGGTPAGWLRKQNRNQRGEGTQDTGAQQNTPTVIRYNAQGDRVD